MYYPYSENNGTDQLRGYREADLRLCFRIRKIRFSHNEAQLLLAAKLQLMKVSSGNLFVKLIYLMQYPRAIENVNIKVYDIDIDKCKLHVILLKYYVYIFIISIKSFQLLFCCLIIPVISNPLRMCIHLNKSYKRTFSNDFFLTKR